MLPWQKRIKTRIRMGAITPIEALEWRIWWRRFAALEAADVGGFLEDLLIIRRLIKMTTNVEYSTAGTNE